MKANSNPFNKQGDPLSDADAHRRKRVTPTSRGELSGCGQHDARTRGTERVAERDGATVGIHLGGIIRKPELTRDCQRLRSERLVEFDRVEITDFQALSLQQFISLPAPARCP